MFFGLKMIIFYKRPVYKPLTIPDRYFIIPCVYYSQKLLDSTAFYYLSLTSHLLLCG